MRRAKPSAKKAHLMHGTESPACNLNYGKRGIVSLTEFNVYTFKTLRLLSSSMPLILRTRVERTRAT